MKDGEREFYVEFGRGFRVAREAGDLSQRELADILGMSGASISNIENGRQIVSAYLAAWMAEHYGLKVAWLLGDVDVAPLAAERSRMKSQLREIRRIVDAS